MSTPQLEALRREIEAKMKFIASLPLCRGDADVFFLAKHQKILGEKEEELELLLEAQRRADVVREHEEMHPPYTEECPICLEDVRISSPDAMSYFVCCGKACCRGCVEIADAAGGAAVLPNCPMCRAKIPTDNANGKRYVKKKLEQQANNGRSWAQHKLGVELTQADKAESLKWLHLAAEQRYPSACAVLATHYGAVEGDYSKARALLKEAADMGMHHCQADLGRKCNRGERGPVNHEQAVLYSTLAYRKDPAAGPQDTQEDLMRKFNLGDEYAELCSQIAQPPDQKAAYELGWSFASGHGVSKSLYRARYYFEEAAKMGDRRVDVPMALTLLEICRAQYDGRTDIPGHSCMPKVLYWARKAADDEFALQMIARIEEEGQSACANCHTDAQSLPDPLKRCVRCRAVWYCGVQCQKKHWKAGHKVDCIKQE